jgi:DNA-binding beta-propeller fold protein YncE
MNRWKSAVVAGFGLWVGSAGCAEPKALVENLDTPVGVAVQPSTGDVFVSVNKAIHRLKKAEGYEASVAVDGFASDIYGKGPKYNIGPLGLHFISPKVLAVGGGDLLDGAEVVRFYAISDKPGSIICSEVMASSGPIAAGASSVKGEGNFYALTQVGSDIFVTCNGDDTKGWISKITLDGEKPGPLTPFIATKEKLSTDAPCGIAVSPAGDLVVSQMGEINVPADSLLCFYDPKTGNLKTQIKTALHDLVSIAYSKKTGKLYGVDFAWMDLAKGALVELVVEGDQVKVNKLADLTKPTAIAIDDEGNGFVTIIGASETGGGKILHFPGL